MKKHRKLIQKMKRRGWNAMMTRNNHLKFTHMQTGMVLIHGGTASDYRAEKNLISLAKKAEELCVTA